MISPITHKERVRLLWANLGGSLKATELEKDRAESPRQDPLTPRPSLCRTSGQRNKFEA